MHTLSGERVRPHRPPQSGRGEMRAFKIPILSKLRIGGSVGKAAEDVKKFLNNTKVLGIPLSAGINAAGHTGLPGIAAAESNRAGGDLDKTKDYLKEDLTQGAKNTSVAYPVVQALDRSGIKGVGATTTTDGKTTAIPGGSGGVNGGVPGTGGGSSIPGVSALQSFLGNFNLGDLALGGLAIAQGANAINLGKKSSQYAEDAMSGVNKSYASREPLRVAGIQGMLNPKTADLSGLLKHSGPYARGLLPAMPAASFQNEAMAPQDEPNRPPGVVPVHRAPLLP